MTARKTQRKLKVMLIDLNLDLLTSTPTWLLVDLCSYFRSYRYKRANRLTFSGYVWVFISTAPKLKLIFKPFPTLLFYKESLFMNHKVACLNAFFSVHPLAESQESQAQSSAMSNSEGKEKGNKKCKIHKRKHRILFIHAFVW